MDNETVAYCAVIIILVIYAITGSQLILALVAVSAVLYVLPLNELPKLLGFLIATDILFSIFLIHTAASTLGGLQIALLAGLIYAMLSRELRRAVGTQHICVNEQVGFANIFTELATQGFAWTTHFIGSAAPPEPLTISWVVGLPGGGFKATRTYKACSYFLPRLFPAVA